MADPVVRFEVGAAEHGPLVELYRELFGWKVPEGAYGQQTTDPAGNLFGLYRHGPH